VLASDATAGSVVNTGSATSTEVPGPVNSAPVTTAVNPLRTLAINFGNGASGPPSSVIPIEVTASNNGSPIAGVTINWALVSGSATLSATSGVTDVNGWSPIDVDVGPTNGPRTVVVSATRSDDPTATVTFTLNVTAVVRTLVISGGNNQTAPANTTLPAPLAVHAQDNGVDAPGITINWAVTAGSATLSAPSSLTGAGGLASVGLTFGAASGPVTVTGTRSDDPTATVTFTETSTVSRTLTIISGNGLIGGPGSTLPALVVNAKNNGVGAPGVVIDWTITAGGAVSGPGGVTAASSSHGVTAASTATLSSATSTTDASGNASVSVTLGSTPGTVTITGTRADDPTVFVTFSVTVGSLGTLPGITPDEHAIGVALDDACQALAALSSRTQDQQDLYLRCLDLVNATTLDPTDVLNALNELFPDLALVQGDASLSAAEAQFQNLKARIAALRSGTQGSSFGGLALTNATGTVTLDSLMPAFGDDKKPEVGKDFSRWGFFASGTIGRANAKAGQLMPAYSYDINGLTAGVDYRKSDKLIFGGAVGFTHQNTDLKDNEGSVKTTGWSVSGYSTYYRENSWYTDAVLTFGHNSYNTKRIIDYSLPLPGGGTTDINQLARSSSGGSMFEGAFTFGRDFQRGALGIGPYGRLLYTRVNFGQINETLNPGAGSGLGVSIDSRDLTSFASQIGAKLTYAHSTSWGVLMPHAQLEWEHEFKSDPQAITAHFLNDPTSTPISFKGDVRDTDFFKLGVGMSMVMAHGRSGFFYVEDLLGRKGYSQYNLAFGLRIEF
jgi:outer membrane autotransporter protein